MTELAQWCWRKAWVLVAAIGGVLQLTAEPVIIPAELGPQIDDLAEAYVALDVFSGVVLVAERGEVVYARAFGLADRARGVPNTRSTRFNIGSMNKAFTKVVVLQLVEEGRLRLDDPLGRWLDGFPPAVAERVTVEHLLNHQSGFGGYHDDGYWGIPMAERSLARTLDRIRALPLQFEPGTERSYSNAGYVLLGAIIERVTGRRYADEVEARIVEPLGLQHTAVRDTAELPDRAIGYLKTMRGEFEDNERFFDRPTPAGGFYSTVDDMLRFYRAFYYGDALWDEVTRSRDELYPFYEQHRDTGGAMVQAGGFEGANTVEYEILRDQISVLVFANMDEPVAEKLGAGILALIRGREPEPPALPALQAVYQAYRRGGVDEVRENFEALTANFPPDDPTDLVLNQVGYNLLFGGELDAAVELLRLNTELFPEVANAWDSLGEALEKQGQSEAALDAYRRALAIRPELPTSRAGVERLTGAGFREKKRSP